MALGSELENSFLSLFFWAERSHSSIFFFFFQVYSLLVLVISGVL